MKILPDDLWLRIFKLGIDNNILDQTDICSVAITCHHFDQITQEPDLWAALLAQNFLSGVLFDQHASKALFRTEYKKMKKNEREMEEMFDEVMEFVMWLDNNFLDQEETFMEDDAFREHTDFGKEPSEDQAHLTNADTSDRNRSNRAYPESYWTTISTILLPKRHYHQSACKSRLGSEQN
ncbi:uncharacterized protein LOC144550255 [Carex rostrata]